MNIMIHNFARFVEYDESVEEVMISYRYKLHFIGFELTRVNLKKNPNNDEQLAKINNINL